MFRLLVLLQDQVNALNRRFKCSESVAVFPFLFPEIRMVDLVGVVVAPVVCAWVGSRPGARSGLNLGLLLQFCNSRVCFW